MFENWVSVLLMVTFVISSANMFSTYKCENKYNDIGAQTVKYIVRPRDDRSVTHSQRIQNESIYKYIFIIYFRLIIFP